MLFAIVVLSLAATSAQANGEEAAPEPPPAEAIIVTGERTARSLRETASSVEVFGEKEIEASGVDRVDQILALVPNVQLGNSSRGPAIRGMDTTGPLSALPAFLGGNRPRTTIVVDGRPVTYNEFIFGTFSVWDLDRIEVFRSPQTTTQGQNSIAGAIFVNTNDPASTPEFRARTIAGDFRMRQVSALASGPIAGDAIAFRVAGDLRYSRTTSRIDDVMAGADPNHDVYGLLRAKLLAKPAAGTRVTLTYSHSQSQAPQVVGVSAPFRERRDEDVGYGLFRINVDSLTAAIHQEVGRNLTANLLVTGGDSKARRFAIPGFGETINDGRDWSAEAILNWQPDGPLRAVGGLSRTHVTLKQFIDLSLVSGSIGRFRDRQDGTGLFANVELDLTTRASVTAGIRYQRDRQVRQGSLAATSFAVPVDFVGTFDAWLPKLTFAYDVTPTLRVGASIQKAYNPGGTTIRIDTSQPDDFKAESLWDYELSARAQFAGGRVTAAANLFYYDMRDAQRAKPIFVFVPSGRAAGFANLFNVPKARSYGAEGRLRWRPDDRLTATIAIGLLGTKVIKTDAESVGLEGNQFDRAPHFTGSAAFDWNANDRLHLSAQVRHHTPYFTEPENTAALRVDSGTSVDARAEYQFARFSIFAQVRNLFDALNMLDLDDPLLGIPQAGEAEDPRTVAIGLETRF